MRSHTRILDAVIVAAVLLGSAPQASAQGCLLLRQTSPLFGTTGAIDQEVGTWNITFTGRATSTKS
jgi:2-methylcitrate dehydratase PrpD